MKYHLLDMETENTQEGVNGTATIKHPPNKYI
jgi:hypothetical protein